MGWAEGGGVKVGGARWGWGGVPPGRWWSGEEERKGGETHWTLCGGGHCRGQRERCTN